MFGEWDGRHLLTLFILMFFNFVILLETISAQNLPLFGDVSHCRQTSIISSALVGNGIVDHSNVVEVSPVDPAPTTSSLST